MEECYYGHHFAVGHEARLVVAVFTGGIQCMFFRLRVKYLQNSSRMQKISINFVSIKGMSIFV